MRGDEAGLERPGRRLGQVEPEGVHLGRVGQRLVELGRVVQVLGREEGLALRRLVRQPDEDPVHHDPDRRLDQQGEAPAERVDLVLLVERHERFVHGLAVAAVLLLEPLHLRLDALELQHRLRALEGERRQQQHDEDGHHGDGDGVVRHEGVEPRQDGGDQVKHGGRLSPGEQRAAEARGRTRGRPKGGSAGGGAWPGTIPSGRRGPPPPRARRSNRTGRTGRARSGPDGRPGTSR